MLPKKKRVTKDVFQTLIKEGKMFSTPLFLFYAQKSSQGQYAFVAPKGVFKRATKRNEFRRLGYNILRYMKTGQQTGIFIYKKQALLATKEEIKNNISYLLQKSV